MQTTQSTKVESENSIESPFQDQMAPAKTLEAIVTAIYLDASTRSRQYILRSNTGHDGE